jgi:hypothetical protein
MIGVCPWHGRGRVAPHRSCTPASSAPPASRAPPPPSATSATTMSSSPSRSRPAPVRRRLPSANRGDGRPRDSRIRQHRGARESAALGLRPSLGWVVREVVVHPREETLKGDPALPLVSIPILSSPSTLREALAAPDRVTVHLRLLACKARTPFIDTRHHAKDLCPSRTATFAPRHATHTHARACRSVSGAAARTRSASGVQALADGRVRPSQPRPFGKALAVTR